MDEDVRFPIGLAIGFLAGFLIMGFSFDNCTNFVPSLSKYENCVNVCKVNDGVEKTYLDGDCVCKNGAEFDAEDIGNNK